ncbi:indolepyruvate ferredoxin oxidoreductase family protein [Streptomyces sp. NPDC048417]|uniref:indolepyruvate ferredoxin oxidoreductase family protein n=1 Tax=Streptomyces sp. NPDC048417 TaxID=3155387 RepID=UPI003443E30D
MPEHSHRGPLDDRYLAESGQFPLTGIQALARLPLDVRRTDRRAGLNTAAFIAGYEGSPLAGYDMELARNLALLDEHDIVFRPAVNEELAATAVQGTQLATAANDARFAGVTGYWYGKSPGLDRAADAIRHGNLMGTHPLGGAVALVGDDPAAKSSTVPGSSEGLLADLGLPTLYPADSQDVLDLGIHAVAMSRACGLWSALKIGTNIADGSGTVEVHPERVIPIVPRLEMAGKPYRHEVTAKVLQPILGELERSREGIRLDIALAYARSNELNKIVRMGAGDRIGIIAAGKTFLDVRQALRIVGLDDDELARRGVRLLRLGVIHPLEPEIVWKFAAGLDEIIVVEDKRPFLETAVKACLYGRPSAPVISGKHTLDGTALLPSEGELDPSLIATALATRFSQAGHFPTVETWRQERQPRRIELPVVTRTPYFCSGCPHNSSTKVPEGSLVGGGIGCHGMVLTMAPRQVGEVAGLTQMGGEGAQWIGMAPFLGRNHLLQNLGDGTYHHSGSLAIRGAVAAGVNITYKLLYNSAVAMTGGQQPAGALSVPQIVTALSAEGVKRIIITTENPRAYRKVKLPRTVEVWPRHRVLEAQETLAKVDGVTVLLHDQECAAELRRKRKRGLAPDPVKRVVINERLCEGCGDCGRKSNCLSVHPTTTEFGRKTRIDQSSCNKDYSCLQGDCPAFLTVVPGDAKARRPHIPSLENDALPKPQILDVAQHTTRIAGVGGTGVVTLAQVLSTAASLAGRHVRTLDQTGLAQKGGSVVSDIKVTAGPIEQAGKAAESEADLYLGCDLLVAADPRYLVTADPRRTVAVVSTSEVPTGAMVTDPRVPFPDSTDLVGRINETTAATDNVFLDARRLAVDLFGDDQVTNILLAGAAYQAGKLPIPAEFIEDAIRLNSARVEANLQAFRRGRQAVADPAGLAKAIQGLPDGKAAERPKPTGTDELTAIVRAPQGSELARLIEIRVPDLISYQNKAYARAYAQVVERVRDVEDDRVPGSTQLAEAVARYLYKLMAYKDEYEVARLALEPSLRADIRTEFGEHARVSYQLHPPILRALGMHSKVSLGCWFVPAFAVLARMRHLRGTRLDPFGYAKVRRLERELISEYREVVASLLDTLNPGNHALAVDIASLPDEIRGYEQIKMDNVSRYRRRLTELRR